MADLPDFIIIGAMKSATSTLQEQMVEQAGIFMSDPKEPNFFSDDDQFSKGIGWYSSLFMGAPEGCLLGEASTHYTKLPTYPDTISRLRAYLPHPRLIYVMRHPIDRLISHYMHEWSMGVYSCNIEDAIEKYQELTAYSQYAAQLEPYFEAYGREAMLPVFFDRLIRNSQAEFERICEFIGYQGEPRWVEGLKPSNTSSERIRRFPLYGLLIDSGIATWLRRKLIPRSFRDAVKAELTLQQRPTLDNQIRAKLESVFDPDLAVLGDRLGVQLNCGNFKETTANKSLEWISVNDR